MRVCVFGSSSSITPDHFLDDSRALARALHQRDHVCVNGGGRFGVMGALNDEGMKVGLKIVGCIHRMWVVDGGEADLKLNDLKIADGDNLVERKRMLIDDVDCFISLAGGMGTWDELWEVAAERQLGIHPRPVCVVNTNGYYDGFIAQMERAYEEKLLKMKPSEVVYVATTVEDAVKYCEDASKRPRGDGVSTVELKKGGSAWKKDRYTAGLVHGVFISIALVMAFNTLTSSRK